jgi:hypothetical protein
MADFASWVVAAEPALRWASSDSSDGSLRASSSPFLDAYRGNRSQANESALESSPAAGLILTLMADRDTLEGTLSDLLAELEKLADEKTRKRRDWPATPRALSGQLRRLAPNLRQAGVGVTFGRHRRTGTPIRLERSCKQPPPPSPPSPPLPEKDLRRDGPVTVAPLNRHQPSRRNPLPHKDGDGGDGSDGEIPACSNSAADDSELL